MFVAVYCSNRRYIYNSGTIKPAGAESKKREERVREEVNNKIRSKGEGREVRGENRGLGKSFSDSFTCDPQSVYRKI